MQSRTNCSLVTFLMYHRKTHHYNFDELFRMMYFKFVLYATECKKITTDKMWHLFIKNTSRDIYSVHKDVLHSANNQKCLSEQKYSHCYWKPNSRTVYNGITVSHRFCFIMKWANILQLLRTWHFHILVVYIDCHDNAI